MPPALNRRAGFVAYIAAATIASSLLYSLWKHPVGTLVAILAFAVICAVSWKWGHSRLKNLAVQRSSGGSICSFARSFDLHHVDPWIVRAVYQEVAGYFKRIGIEVNFQAEDDLIKDLGIDPEDLDMDMATSIASRTGRTLEGYEANPYYATTTTVRGLVMFINAQPREAYQLV